MNVSAYLLTSLGRSKHSDDGHLGRDFLLASPILVEDLGIEVGKVCLVVIDTIEPDAKRVHRIYVVRELMQANGLDIIVLEAERVFTCETC